MAYYELTIKINSPFRDNLIQKLTEAGCLGVIEQDNGIIAYFPETIDINAISGHISLFKALLDKSGQPSDITFNHKSIPHEDWNETWKKGFHAIDIGERFTILPPWEEKKKDRINIIIDPAMAFGTGHHETTRSCLVLLEKYADKTGKDTFLDLGTGTGVLAIAASKLGYRQVVGIDTDPLAVEAAQKNIELNQTPDVQISQGGLTELSENFDVIAANLISGVLVQLASLLAAHLKSGGIAILSGILFGQEDDVIEAMKVEGLKLVEKYPDGKWVSLVVKK
jgi:ribosomal protein L11 methyltransferase